MGETESRIIFINTLFLLVLVFANKSRHEFLGIQQNVRVISRETLGQKSDSKADESPRIYDSRALIFPTQVARRKFLIDIVAITDLDLHYRR